MAEDVQTNLRIPIDLKNRLTAAAIENNRSLSAEVTYRLELTFKAREQLVEHAEADLRKFVDGMIEEKLAALQPEIERRVQDAHDRLATIDPPRLGAKRKK